MPERIDLTQLPLLNHLTKDYLKQDPFLRDFYSHTHELSSYANLIQDRLDFSADKRELLVTELLSQYEEAGIALKDDSLVKQNILALKNSNCFTVTTGHQLVLFGGPLFTAYKIVDAIQLASELNKTYPKQKIVPVFWLASEDHDFEEIKNTFVAGETITWNANHQGEAVGQLKTSEFEKLINELEQLLPKTGFRSLRIQQIKDAYLQDGSHLASASLRYFHDLFAEYGLVIIEPSRSAFKRQFGSVVQADVLHQTTYQAQQKSDKKLAEKYQLQIGAREINFFYFDQNAKRILIKKSAKGFVLADHSASFTYSEMESLIQQYPERFSPNVNLRPLYQETILPNLAYIGGPAEVAYWLQLKSIFDTYQLPFPAVVLRMMHLFLPPGFSNRMARFGLETKDAFQNLQDLSSRYFELIGESSIEKQIETILHAWQEIYELSSKVNDELQAAALAEKLKEKAELKSIHKEYQEKRKQKHENKLDKIFKVRAEIYPAGVLQERIETLLYYECLLDKPLIPHLLEICRVFENSLILTHA